ncbi:MULTISPECIES: Mov34/MPN/PAD-1 family protein [Methylobacteriaceae]|jgi:hypothetical protein|uniref:JAB domain-containing protein n=6 Tax=Methylobacteriaceae TaxID=119045 RepID=A0A509EIN2_9HYPH|nr:MULTISPECIES: Mov34/MPN/PAD-1 family protein [Methylobacteriaceae]MRI53672.1 hypothetical protein [Methylobacterium sp. DB1607]ACS40458.1 conserved hypothetical protein [Methylorubrum extorquens AM1]MBD8906499.1 hypothetical protein [Methylorubrum zatmanii]MCP1541396.1 proteasome lid subunit RPN8/RPN11 [Methylorubrum extorquens]MCP1586068.1 proteasome lid subunit RPN8/RPN11 [Methylorubrum extorquens]
MTAVACTAAILAETLDRLRVGGRRGEERAVLWLARSASAAPTPVQEVYEPEQATAEDYFHLPPASMRALMGHLRAHRLKIVAQVHTHPGRAFHSEADDAWAIVRHRGALSLVLPRFAATATPGTFLEEAMVYELSDAGLWEHVRRPGERIRIEVTP